MTTREDEVKALDRIIVARTRVRSGVAGDWVWMVRDEIGLVVGHGMSYGYQGCVEAIRYAVSTYTLRFDGPIPDFTIAQPEGDEVLDLEETKRQIIAELGPTALAHRGGFPPISVDAKVPTEWGKLADSEPDVR